MSKSKLRKLGLAFLGLGLLSATQGVLADNVPANRTITTIRAFGDWAAVVFTPPYTNDVGCADPTSDRTVVIDWQADPTKKSMYAALLGAYMTGKKIGVGITGCWMSYGLGVPRVYRVDVKD